ncbi:MAG: hypothetical protein P4L51_09340 [Puia sp.]|nr:hypothetical protein [Puia sp.]
MKRSRIIIIIILSGCLLAFSKGVQAQGSPFSKFQGVGGGGEGKKDSLAHRSGLEDSITINFRYLDSSRYRKLDSSLFNFSKLVPPPRTYIDLGNLGTPSRDLVFSPRMVSGWDAGLHGLDTYTFNVPETRFYNTTRPYSTLGYLQGSKNELMVDLFHTQNIKPNWNFAFEYRFLNSVGTFNNQHSNDNNYRFSSWYQSRSKRYQNFVVIVGSKLQVGENGGIKSASDLDSNSYSLGATLPTQIGGNTIANGNPFSTNIATGTKYATGTFLMRQQYDLGQKDSIVTDSTVIPLFYPRLRIEHTLTYSTYDFNFIDQPDPLNSQPLDSAYYASFYNLKSLTGSDTIVRRDNWKILTNDFSLYQFPDSKNAQQFIKVGASYESLKGFFDTSYTLKGAVSSYNLFLHGEYRNKTRNQKWDIEANGKLYLSGFNSGDYNAYISLKRYISRQVGYLQVGFQDVSRTPSFTFNPESSFYLDQFHKFNKENTTNIFASLEQPQHHLILKGSYYLISNYSYYSDYYKASQESTLFNLLQISLEKQITIYRHWKWWTQTYLQQVAGASPVNVPLVLSNNRVGYVGNFGFRNLNISFGLEIRYFTPYKADGYAPLTGQFFTQKDTTISQHLPDITGYLHFRVRSLTAYVRTENLNTMRIGPNGFGFSNYNFVGPNYPSPGLLIRVGFSWGFVD